MGGALPTEVLRDAFLRQMEELRAVVENRLPGYWFRSVVVAQVWSLLGTKK